MSIFMFEPSRPSFLRTRLGTRLRRMREAAGLTLDEASLLLDKTRSALHRIETGETKPDVHLIRSMMDVYDGHDRDLVHEVRKARKRPWYQAHGVKSRYHVDVETEAAWVCDFSPLVVPELLQTTQYMMALLKHWDHPAPSDELNVLRMRQKRLSERKRPLQLITIIEETVLRRTIGGLPTMRKQLKHLIQAAALPTVALHILPAEDHGPCAAAGAFTLLTLPGSSDPDLLHGVHLAGPFDTEDPKKLAYARGVFEHLRSQALGTVESIELIDRTLTETYR